MKMIYLKPINYFISFIILTLLACSKKNEVLNSGNNGDKYPISFSVSGFTQTIVPLVILSSKRNGALSDGPSTGNTTTNITKYIKQLVIRIYTVNGSGNEIFYHDLFVDSTNLANNQIQDSLPYGSYHAYALAKNATITKGVPYHGANYANIQDSSATFYMSGQDNWGYTTMDYSDYYIDSIRKDFAIDGRTAVNPILNMSRFGSLLEVKIKDASLYPNQVFSVAFSAYANAYNFRNKNLSYMGYSAGRTPSVLVSNGDLNITQNYTNKTFSVTIFTKINGNTVSKQIDNVICYKNRKTILEGNFFDSTGTNNKPNFNVNLTGEYDSIPVNVKF